MSGHGQFFDDVGDSLAELDDGFQILGGYFCMVCVLCCVSNDCTQNTLSSLICLLGTDKSSLDL